MLLTASGGAIPASTKVLPVTQMIGRAGVTDMTESRQAKRGADDPPVDEGPSRRRSRRDPDDRVPDLVRLRLPVSDLLRLSHARTLTRRAARRSALQVVHPRPAGGLRQPRSQDPHELRRRRRPHLQPRIRQVVLDGRVRQAEAVGGGLLRPGRGAREPVWIGPARRHAVKGAGGALRFLFGRLGHAARGRGPRSGL